MGESKGVLICKLNLVVTLVVWRQDIGLPLRPEV
jgi:hypothetical protein